MGCRGRAVMRLTDGTIYPTVKDAAAANHVTSSAIVCAINRNGKAGRHHWAYLDSLALPPPPPKPPPPPPSPPEPDPLPFDVERFIAELDVYIRWHAKGAVKTKDAWAAVQHLWRKTGAHIYAATLRSDP